jgi:hypothetical protein
LADRLNDMRKYVFSSTPFDAPEWNSTVVIGGDIVGEARRLKQESGGDLVIWGHTRHADASDGSSVIEPKPRP